MSCVICGSPELCAIGGLCEGCDFAWGVSSEGARADWFFESYETEPSLAISAANTAFMDFINRRRAERLNSDA